MKVSEFMENCVMLGIAVGVLTVCYVILSVVYQDNQRLCVETSTGWTPPEIPKCEEELWERIKDRCASSPSSP